MRLLIAAVVLMVTGTSAQAADLRLTFPALKAGGQVTYAVFDSKAKWDAKAPARVGGNLAKGQTSIRLELPPGTYAVMAYHDRNTDGKLNTLPVGLPTEPYGFSNNSRATFGPPSWTAASFKLDERGALQTIRLH